MAVRASTKIPPPRSSSSLHHLQSLRVSWNISDSGLEYLVVFHRHLKVLVLSGCSAISDRGVETLAPLGASLETLELAYCKRITSDAARCFSLWSRLKAIDVRGTSIVDTVGAQYVASLAVGYWGLRSLILFDSHCLNDECLRSIAKCTQLEVLNIGCFSNFTDNGLRHLVTLTKLTTLQLASCRQVTDEGLGVLLPAVANTLEVLDLEMVERVTDDTLAHIGKLTRLKRLSLARCTNITDDGVHCLRFLRNLQHLNLRGCDDLTDDVADSIICLELLEDLNLEFCVWITSYLCDKLNGRLQSLRVTKNKMPADTAVMMAKTAKRNRLESKARREASRATSPEQNPSAGATRVRKVCVVM